MWLRSEDISRVFSIETNNFAFEIKVILGQKSTHPGSQVVEIGLNDPVAYRVKV